MTAVRPGHDETARNIEMAPRWFTDGWLGLVPPTEVFDPSLTTNGVKVGTEGPYANIAARLAGFTDLRTAIMDLHGAGNVVTVQVRWTGPEAGVSSPR
jgi:hypothetical protein